ncbi:hypothetical protein LSUE1_G000613 [Lachnellula suecica]|uniref:Sfi1 spindle body domain-containing protein n=1 Tax=Lachnellula suecica TaxID=602035 RepID=A0A8T9CJ69_9HELO|nr:hypothetical protein LSUE1_G000613 [Lachnellula suecica]
MPPSGTPPQANEGQATRNTEPYYSNEGKYVAILHDIVVLAQALLPTLPERERLPTNALFNAYYETLPRVGIDADHDSRYARVLFKIGGLRGEGTLYEKFEEILSRMGIEIEFGNNDEEEEAYSPLGGSQADVEDATAGTTSPQDEILESTQHRRRNSESSFWDTGNAVGPVVRPRRNSFSSIAQVTPKPAERQQFLQEIQPKQPKAAIPVVNPELKEDPQGHIGAWLNSHQERPGRRRRGSVSTQSSLRIHRRAPLTTDGRRGHNVNPSAPTSDNYGAVSEDTAVTSALDYDTVSTESLEKYSKNQEVHDLMQIKASLLLKDHLNSVIRRQLPLWRQKALQAREHHQILDRIAVKHDSHILLTIVLANWQRLWLHNHQVRETKRFYAHLERRAAKARDMFVMVKVLQNWSAAAQHQVNRTAAARQYIVKYRIFNAWAEVTAVNDFKVRRHVLNKFLGAWRQRHANVHAANEYAIQRYEDNLVEKTYWQWIRKKMDAKATAWWAEGAKRRSLFNLIARYHETWEDHRTAEEARRYRLVWNAWRIWRDTTTKLARQRERANEFDQVRILRKAFSKWTGEARVVPAKIAVQTDVKQRILGDTFALWLHRTRQEMYASEVDRIKILREAVTTWRYEYRSRRLCAQVDSRLKAGTLYKLMEAQQQALVERRRKERWLRRIMLTWMDKAKIMKEERLHREAVALSYLAQRSQRTTMDYWVERTQIAREQESMALTLYQPRLLQRTVMQWSERAQHVEKLEGWSRDAEFYFLTTKIIKRWKASTEAAKREKRKLAYTQVRRTVKINLATGILRGWRQQARHVLDLQDQAQSVRQNKDVVRGMDIFDQWRAEAAYVAELEPIWRENVLKKHFSVWKERSNAYQALETEAILTYEEKRETRTFKKWNIAALQVRSQTNYAYDIREKNAKRTFRKMLSYWRQKAAVKRPPKIPDPEEPPEELGATVRAETWSEYGDAAGNDEEAAPSTPIPGYLSTPSKRSERVMAVAARFSTTPRAPLSTPFEKQLRAQYSGGQLHSFRKGTMKSTLGISRGFDDIEEKRHE